MFALKNDMKRWKLVSSLLSAFILAAGTMGQDSVQPKTLESNETKVPVVEFCDLMADKERYVGKLIRTTVVAEYLITMEYVLHTKCGEKKPRVSLGFKDDIESQTEALGSEMYRQRNHSLTITATGVLQSAKAKGLAGFGHYQWSKFQFEIYSYTVQ